MLRRVGSGRLVLWMVFALVVSSMVSCKDDSIGIGKGILPGTDDYLLFQDANLSVNTSNAEGQPVRVNPSKPTDLYSDAPSYFHHAFGFHSDPVFGTVSADVVFPFLMETVGKNFGEGATVDSLILYLKYQTKVGSESNPIGFELYELSKIMDDTIKYTSDYSVTGTYHSPLIASGTFQPAVSDSFASIRITNASLIHKLISLDSTAMVNDSTFWKHFSGFYMKPVPQSSNGQMYFLSFFISEMDMFYHNNTADSMFFRYLGYPYASVSSIHRNYSGTPVAAAIASGMPGDFSYIAASAGPVAPLRFPESGLEQWFDGITENKQKVVAFNKVQLDLYPAAGQNVKNMPKSLSLMKQNEDGSYEGIDYLTAASYNADKGCYTFDITVFIQDHIKLYYANSLSDPNLVLVAGQNPYTPYQVVIDNQRTKIRTVYSQSQ